MESNVDFFMNLFWWGFTIILAGCLIYFAIEEAGNNKNN
jgi:hypothetical protein